MPITKPAKQTDNYRKINFIGARILQTSELNRLQTFDAVRSSGTLGPIFREGGTLNVTCTVNPTNVVLSPTDPTQPMRVFLNGAFEPIPAPDGSLTIAFSPRTSGSEAVYLSWVLWKVTKDGSGNSIADPDLKDPSGEPIGEAGQIQVIVDGVSYHTEPIDATGMLSKSTQAIKIFEFSWNPDATLSKLWTQNVQNTAWGSELQYGPVALSAPGADGVACATSDPRLIDTRVPRDLSVNTSKVSSPVAAASGAFGQEYSLSETAGGILSYKIVYEGFKTSLRTAMDWVVAKINSLLSTSTNHENRITTLENAAPPSIDLGYHVGQPIGLNGTHPPLVKLSGVQAFVVQCPNDYQNTSAPPAITVLGPENEPKCRISQNGDYYLDNPAILATLGNEFASYASFAMNYKLFRNAVNALLQGGVNPPPQSGGLPTTTLAGDVEGAMGSTTVSRLRGKVVPTPGSGDAGKLLGFDGTAWSLINPPSSPGGVANLSGDVTGSVTGTTVEKIRGRAVAPTAPTDGQLLGWDASNSQWVPMTPAGATPNSLTDNGGYRIANMGSVKMAFATFSVQDGDSIIPPAGFSWDWHTVSLGITVHNNSNPLQVLYNNATHRVEFYTWPAGTAIREGRNGAVADAHVVFINVA